MPAWWRCFPFSIFVFEPFHALASSLSALSPQLSLVGRMHFSACVTITIFLPEIAPPLSSYGSPYLNFHIHSHPFWDFMWFHSSAQSRLWLSTAPPAISPTTRGDPAAKGLSWGPQYLIWWLGHTRQPMVAWFCFGLVLSSKESILSSCRRTGRVGKLVKKNSEMYDNYLKCCPGGWW